MLTKSDVLVDPVLSNVSIKLSNEGFIADQIMPIVRVKKQSGLFYKYDNANFRINKTLRASGAAANEVSFGLTTDTYSCADHALKDFIPDDVVDNADMALSPLVDATENVTEQLLLDRERALAVIMADTGNLSSNTTLSGTDQWSDYQNSDPIGDVRTARGTIHGDVFKKPNTLVLSKEVFDVLVDHPAIIERIKYSALGVVTAELLARLFQVEKVIVGEAGYETAVEGQASSLGYVWGKHAWLLYISPRVGLKTLTFGWTFTWKERVVKRWRDEDREGTYVRVGSDNYSHKIVSASCGYLIKNAVA